MLLNIARAVFGSKNSRTLAKLQPTVKKINDFSSIIESMTDEELKAQTIKFKLMLKEGKTLDDILPEAFATVREAASRVLGERHYDTQLLGGIILHNSNIAEMKTGEGKTLVATLPAYLNALSEKGVHVITVNDYLAKRDGLWMAQVFNFLGLTCTYLTAELNHEERKEAYKADVLYATNNELGFDYLRDNMAFHQEALVQRELNFAIVDEVDSILIDEARVPLIISGQAEDSTEKYRRYNALVPKLKKDIDFKVDEKSKNVTLTEEGSVNIEKILQQSGVLPKGQGLYDIESVDSVHHINVAISAHNIFENDKDYIVKDGEVILIDDFTGRMGIGRRLSNGLHQALEAKEGLEIKAESESLASITYQNFFRLYNGLSGMTGTAMTEVDEFEQIYSLEVIEVPTNTDVQRIDEDDTIYLSKPVKMSFILDDIKDCYARKQPTLVGTGSIDNSEEISALLKKHKVPHTVLNAKYHEREAEIIAQAGKPSAITIATHMAGRGTDIKLGGSLELLLKDVDSAEERAKIKDLYEKDKIVAREAGGLRVISTQRNESRRIDNQLRGRSGRQGDVGSSKFYISLDDDLMRIFGGPLKSITDKLNMPEDEAIEHPLLTKSIEVAQRKIESRNFDMRKEVLKYDDVLNVQRKVVYSQRKDFLFEENKLEIVEGFIEEVVEGIIYGSLTGEKAKVNEQRIEDELFRLFNIKASVSSYIDAKDVEKTINNILVMVLKKYDEKYKTLPINVANGIHKDMFLQILDHHWKEHNKNLEVIRSTIHLRGVAQKNPLTEYKTQAFDMFKNLLNSAREEAVMHLMHIEVKQVEDEPVMKQTEADKPKEFEAPASRNAQCPCGSGNKYKHCCGKI